MGNPSPDVCRDYWIVFAKDTAKSAGLLLRLMLFDFLGLGQASASLPSMHDQGRVWGHSVAIRAAIEGVRWHGLRRTWASGLAQQGMLLNVLQALGGRKTEAMMRRDMPLALAQLVEQSERVASVLSGTNLVQRGEKRREG